MLGQKSWLIEKQAKTIRRTVAATDTLQGLGRTPQFIRLKPERIHRT